MNDRSTLADELKLREANSDPIKVHPELNCISSPRVRDRIFSKSFSYEQANVPIIMCLRGLLNLDSRYMSCCSISKTRQT